MGWPPPLAKQQKSKAIRRRVGCHPKNGFSPAELALDLAILAQSNQRKLHGGKILFWEEH
jgi:hypothetical protein